MCRSWLSASPAAAHRARRATAPSDWYDSLLPAASQTSRMLPTRDARALPLENEDAWIAMRMRCSSLEVAPLEARELYPRVGTRGKARNASAQAARLSHTHPT